MRELSEGSTLRRMGVLLTVAGPVANLALASGGMALLLILLKAEPTLIGVAIFGLYFIGLGMIYTIMRPVLRLLGVSRIFQVIVITVGITFVAFLAAYLA